MTIKLIKKFFLFLLIMTIIQIVILILSFAISMDGANRYSGQSNFLHGFLKYVLGFPLYIIFDFDSLINSREFRIELIPLLFINTLIQFIIYKVGILALKLRRQSLDKLIKNSKKPIFYGTQ